MFAGEGNLTRAVASSCRIRAREHRLLTASREALVAITASPMCSALLGPRVVGQVLDPSLRALRVAIQRLSSVSFRGVPGPSQSSQPSQLLPSSEPQDTRGDHASGHPPNPPAAPTTNRDEILDPFRPAATLRHRMVAKREEEPSQDLNESLDVDAPATPEAPDTAFLAPTSAPPSLLPIPPPLPPRSDDISVPMTSSPPRPPSPTFERRHRPQQREWLSTPTSVSRPPSVVVRPPRPWPSQENPRTQPRLTEFIRIPPAPGAVGRVAVDTKRRRRRDEDDEARDEDARAGQHQARVLAGPPAMHASPLASNSTEPMVTRPVVAQLGIIDTVEPTAKRLCATLPVHPSVSRDRQLPTAPVFTPPLAADTLPSTCKGTLREASPTPTPGQSGPRASRHPPRRPPSPERRLGTITTLNPAVYRETVRSRVERRQLPATTCVECQRYFESVYPDPAEREQRIREVSRHRCTCPPPVHETSASFWAMEFPATQGDPYQAHLLAFPRPARPQPAPSPPPCQLVRSRHGCVGLERG